MENVEAAMKEQVDETHFHCSTLERRATLEYRGKDQHMILFTNLSSIFGRSVAGVSSFTTTN